MNDSDDIKRVLNEYFEALKRSDMATVSKLSTKKMFRQCGFRFRFGFFIARILFRSRIQNAVIEDVSIETQDGAKAVVSYVTTFGVRRQYERTVFLKTNGKWKVDGKFA